MIYAASEPRQVVKGCSPPVLPRTLLPGAPAQNAQPGSCSSGTSPCRMHTCPLRSPCTRVVLLLPDSNPSDSGSTAIVQLLAQTCPASTPHTRLSHAPQVHSQSVPRRTQLRPCRRTDGPVGTGYTPHAPRRAVLLCSAARCSPIGWRTCGLLAQRFTG